MSKIIENTCTLCDEKIIEDDSVYSNTEPLKSNALKGEVKCKVKCKICGEITPCNGENTTINTK